MLFKGKTYMIWMGTTEKWYKFRDIDEEMVEQLALLIRNEKQAEDCFYKHLEFGTGGMI
jgi:phosphoglucomutase